MHHRNSAFDLRWQITVTLLIKLAALVAIWWFFVHDHRVPHDAEHTAAKILAS